MSSLSYSARSLSPILPVDDVSRAVGFYTDVLGFTVNVNSPDYAVLQRDTASLHLTKVSNEGVLQAIRGHMSIYLDVQNIESLWTHVSQFKDRYKIRDLFDREYGMREFHIIDPDGCLVFVGQEIAAK